MPNSGLFRGGSLRRHLGCLLLGMCLFCFPILYVDAHGGSGSGGSGSGSGSSGSSGSGSSSGGHGGPGGSMGSSSAAPGGLPGNGSASSGTGHGGTGHGSGHASSSTNAHGTAVAHNATMAVAKNSATRNQILRNGFTSDTMLPRSDRIRNRQITSTGGFTPETYPRKKLKKNNALATKNTTQNSAAH